MNENLLFSLLSDTNQRQRHTLHNERFWSQANLGLKFSPSSYTTCFFSSSTLVVRELPTMIMLGIDHQK